MRANYFHNTVQRGGSRGAVHNYAKSYEDWHQKKQKKHLMNVQRSLVPFIPGGYLSQVTRWHPEAAELLCSKRLLAHARV